MITTRSLDIGDEHAWRELWRDYLAFYETELPKVVYETTFARMIDPSIVDQNGIIAICEGEPAGLAHYIFHRHGWRIEGVCYLQDLFVASKFRSRGVGQALIDAVYEAADAAGTSEVYWLTQEQNAVARRLYDRVGVATSFVKYRR